MTSPRGDRRRRPPSAARRQRNVRLVVEYDGGGFEGWEEREGARTAGGILRATLQRVLDERVTLVTSSRPDAGVHVEGLVANFLTKSSTSSQELATALDADLPHDLTIVRADDAEPDFHARGWASSHVHRYHITRRRSPLQRGRAAVFAEPLTLTKLHAATRRIAGLHDFASFCPPDLPHSAPTKLKVTHAAWKQVRDVLVLRVAASHVPSGLLPRLTAALLSVASDTLPHRDFVRLLHRPDRAVDGRALDACGLYLEHVEFQAPGTEPVEEPEPQDTTEEETDEISPTAKRAIEALKTELQGKVFESE